MAYGRSACWHINNYKLLCILVDWAKFQTKANEAGWIMHGLLLDFQTDFNSSNRIDARIKIVCAIVAILAIMMFAHWQTALIFTLVCIMIAALSHIKLYFKHLIHPLYIVALISIIQPFTYGSTIIAKIPLLSIPIFFEGIWFGILIAARCTAAISILILLIHTTSIMEIIRALAWFHIPSILLDIALLMLRCVFLLFEEAEIIYKAQQSRCG
ncbi:MAG: energy-coupling factor transporter transmembrane component T, partial [Nitrososphaerota archaeon]|nr:energy-coupling factor transporter transmembrane component T [Nitrososphaerota archaeon]